MGLVSHNNCNIFDRPEATFDNPDFVDVVIQSYRHRYNLV